MDSKYLEERIIRTSPMTYEQLEEIKHHFQYLIWRNLKYCMKLSKELSMLGLKLDKIIEILEFIVKKVDDDKLIETYVDKIIKTILEDTKLFNKEFTRQFSPYLSHVFNKIKEESLETN